MTSRVLLAGVVLLLVWTRVRISAQDLVRERRNSPFGGEGARPEFSFAVAPPHFKNPNHARDWRFGHHPRAINTDLSYQPRGAESTRPNPNIHLNFRLDPYADQRNNFHSNSHPKPKQHFNSYVRHDERRHNRPHQQNRFVPRPSVHPRPAPNPSIASREPTVPHGHQNLQHNQHLQQHQPHESGQQHQQHQQQQTQQVQHEFTAPRNQHSHNDHGQVQYENPEVQIDQTEYGEQVEYAEYGDPNVPADQTKFEEQHYPTEEIQYEDQPTEYEDPPVAYEDQPIQYEDQPIHVNQTQYNDQEFPVYQYEYDDREVPVNQTDYEYSQDHPDYEQHPEQLDTVSQNQKNQKSREEPHIPEVSLIQEQTTEKPLVDNPEDTITASSIPEQGNEDEQIESETDSPTKEVPIEKRPLSSKTGNLAALLAGASTIGLKDPRQQEPSKPTRPLKREQSPSKTRTSVPEHIKPPVQPSSPEYYDELYDEFVDMYFDEEGGKEGDKTKVKNSEQTSPATREHIPRRKNARTTTTTTTPKPTQPSTTTTTTTKLTTLKTSTTKTTTESTTTAAKPKTVKTEKVKEEPVAKSGRPQASISLSEILQELGLSLPQFLGTLKTHGTSLKNFTVKLQAKSLSKSEFRRAKGNVKVLLEILENSADGPSEDVQSKSVQTTPSTSTKVDELTSSSSFRRRLPPKNTTPVSTTPPPRTTTTTTSTSTSTTKEEEEIETSTQAMSEKPRLFGSRPSGISFTQLDPKKKKSEEEVAKNQPESSKPAIAIQLDIATLAKEKGMSAAGILQDFETMFNISAPSSTEQKIPITTPPEVEAKTTVSLRPYRPSPERNRPYHHPRGNPNIHRGIVSNRMSSTARPTLRPPYVPRPISVNSEEKDQETTKKLSEKETVTSEQEDEPPIQSNRNQEAKDKNKYNKELYNYNLVKNNAESMNVSTKSAIMAAGVLGGVALSVFIAIFIVVKYKGHVHRHRRRMPLTLPSDSSSSSLPPIYATRSTYSKECYQTSGFWTTLKKRFDPYSPSTSPSSM